ncbi:MAG: MFS transporter [Gemmatimonadaceae bacterium]
MTAGSSSVADFGHAPSRAVGAMPWRASLLLGAGTLVVGAVWPLYDSYVPPLLQRHLGSSVWVGAAMGIDNLLALFLVPLVGALSDATRTPLGRRMPFVLTALPIAAMGLAAIPFAERYGTFALLMTIVVMNLAMAGWRAPFTALLAELVPSAHRSKTNGINGVAMCLGAMLVLSTAAALSARNAALPFLLSASLLAVVWLTHLLWLREDVDAERADAPVAPVAPARALGVLWRAGGGLAPRFFVGCLFFQMAFQSFSSWFTLHGSERFGITVAQASLGFIAVAIATLVASVPAGWLGARFGRRRMALVGIAGMALACGVLQFVPTLSAAIAVLALFGFSWSFPVANLMPMALELGTAARAGSLAGAFLLIQSLAGVIGPAIVGSAFDITGSKRNLFVLLASFLTLAFIVLATLRRGFGETSPVADR